MRLTTPAGPTLKAKPTPVFAPGLDNLWRIGAVQSVRNADLSPADQLASLLAALSGL